MTNDAERWTVLALINWTSEYLSKAGVDQSRLGAEILLAHTLGCERIELYTRFDHEPSEQQRQQFRRLVRRAAGREPIGYLVGYKEFYSLPIKVTHDVLIPRPETEIIVAESLAHLATLGRPGCLWDVGSGSGCIAVAIAVNNADAQVLATDISAGAVAVAADNAAAHDVADRVCCLAADMLAMPADWPGPGQFDVIAANLPYVARGEEVAREVEYEPGIALWAGRTGMIFLKRIIDDSPPLLSPGGALIVEFGLDQADDVRDMMVETGFEEPNLVKDHQDLERTAVAIWLG